MPARPRRVGLQEIGLPYAADPAVTKHLARFLARQAAAYSGAAPIRRGPSGLACPTHVLFNGGVMKADALRHRIVDVLNLWVTAEGFAALDERHVLEAPDLDRAVAHGAAYYGLARRGRGVRIRSGAARRPEGLGGGAGPEIWGEAAERGSGRFRCAIQATPMCWPSAVRTWSGC